MGIILWDAGKAEHLDAFSRYVEIQRPERLFAILTRTRTGTDVVIRPRVQSRLDSALIRNMTEKTWAMLREDPAISKLLAIEADGYLWAEDRFKTQTEEEL